MAKTAKPTQEVDRAVEFQQKLVAHVADVGEPLDVLDDGVEFVAVDDEQAAAIGGPCGSRGGR